MPNTTNDQRRHFDAVSLARARKGIIDPAPVPLPSGTMLVRFGSDAHNAAFGCWWLTEAEYRRVADWAAMHSLSVPLAARALCAVAHNWGRGSAAGANMLAQVRATVRQPLIAHHGITRPQRIRDAQGRLIEGFDNPVTIAGGPIRQLFVPGLDKADISRRYLTIEPGTFHAIGDSHIFGVPGVPAGTMRH